MRFEFAEPTRIIFGEGTTSEIVSLTQKWGKRVLLITGGGEGTPFLIQELFSAAGVPVTLFRVAREPTIDVVEIGVRLARSSGADVIVGCGGGSVIDTAKAVSCLATNPGEVLDYLEVVGKGMALQYQGLPVIAVPTTAGTGSEVTKNAVLGAPKNRMKVSLRSSFLYPRAAVVDPVLAYSVPPAITASTGMDALTQVLEPFVSLRANPITDMFCRDGMARIGRSLLNAYQDGNNSLARQDMSWGSLMGGLALANAGLGVVHGFASPIGGMFQAPHGVICARLLAPGIEMNLRALKAQGLENPTLNRYAEAARIVTGNSKASSQDLVEWVKELCQSLHILRLSELGITQSDIPAIVENARIASSMKSNPINLTSEELFEILEMAL